MELTAGDGPTLVEAVAQRARLVHAALGGLDEVGLGAASQLEGWSRLTVACHLRYGARALLRMTVDGMEGQPTSYYPGGRAVVRPGTLMPDAGEAGSAVVASLVAADDALVEQWRALAANDWERLIVEPAEQTDLGPTRLLRLALMRLTELEVHGSDLGLDGALDDWSDTFVRLALPFRLDWLNERRTNHRDFDAALKGSWLLRATDGPSYLVTTDGSAVTSVPCSPEASARAELAGDSRDLLALLLGRPLQNPLSVSGDAAFGAAFSRAFPGP